MSTVPQAAPFGFLWIRCGASQKLWRVPMALPGPIASDSARKRVAASPDRIVGVSDAELSRLFHRLNNQLGIMLIVEKQPWANTLDLTLAVEAAMAELQPGLGDIAVDTKIFRPATFIERSIENLTQAMLIGCVLVVIVLVMFLFDWRAALISATAIPLSLIAAALVLYYRGGTINTMVIVNRPLTPGALARAVVTMTEGKSAALQRLAVPSRRHVDLATGTGTDQYCLAAPASGGRPLTSASPHMKLGELIGVATRNATVEALRWQNGLEASYTRGLFHALGRYGVREATIFEDIAPYRHLGIEPPPLRLLINRVHPVSSNARLVQQALRQVFQEQAGVQVLGTDVPAIEAYPRAATRGLPVHRVEYRQPAGRTAPAALETATANSARLIRTGQAQQQGFTANQFRDSICGQVLDLFNCTSGLSMDVRTYQTFDSINLLNPVDENGQLVTNNFTYQPGNGTDIVVVRVFYEWPTFSSLLGLNLNNMANGKHLLAATAAFRNEPFPW